MPNYLRNKRVAAFNRQNGLCFYCDQPMWLHDTFTFSILHGITLKQARDFQCTAEHLVARCDGGNNSEKNIAAACLCCNQRRHKRKNPPDPENYQRLVRQKLERNKWHVKLPKKGQSALIGTLNSLAHPSKHKPINTP